MTASLITGNPVVVKPHPRAVLPLAITVEIARNVLLENVFDPNLVQLAAEADGEELARTLAERPEVAIIDHTGGPRFGEWLEREGDSRGARAVVSGDTTSRLGAEGEPKSERRFDL